MRFLTAGESHGPALTTIVEGCPAGVPLEAAYLDRQLRRRQGGYGRGGRMRIESDRAEILSGVRFGSTLGGPVAVVVRNLDFRSWREAMAVEGPAPEGEGARPVHRPRPGHADLAGALKFAARDARPVLERASARETAARTVAGAVARAFLESLGMGVTSHTVAVGRAALEEGCLVSFEEAAALDDDLPLRTPDEALRRAMVAEIDACRGEGDSCGAVFEVIASGVPAGLGSMAHWDRRLDGRLAQALVSIPGVKGVEIGSAVRGSRVRGSEHHDEILADADGALRRPTNRAGGIEGGMSNGEEIRARAYLKPVSTLPRPLRSVDLRTGEQAEAAVERTDAVPAVAAGVVGEAVVALVLARACLEKLGGDTLEEVRRNLEAYRGSQPFPIAGFRGLKK